MSYNAEFSGAELIYSKDFPISKPIGLELANMSVELSSGDLPVAQKWQLIDAVRQLTDKQARDVLQNRLLPFVFMLGETLYAAAGPVGFATARERDVKVVAQAVPEDLLQALQLVLGKQILHTHAFIWPTIRQSIVPQDG